MSFLTNSAFFGGIPAPGQSQNPAGKGFVGKKNSQTVSIQEGSRTEKNTKNKESWKKNAIMISSVRKFVIEGMAAIKLDGS